MEFINKLDKDDTIVAIATPPGEGAIAIVRLSGKEAVSISQKIFSGSVTKYKSHTVHFGKILDSKGQVIDNVLLLLMRSPNSYTGEDSIEFQCHGGRLISKGVLERCIEAGARLAKEGEFTLRAFLNGKLDLSQAEAVEQLIHAKSLAALHAAEKNLSGKLSETITLFQKNLIDIAAELEAIIDFPEEDLELSSYSKLQIELAKLFEKMEKLSSTFYQGKRLFDGATICICGAPNVGKSSLMNALCAKERSIVTPIPGTTRDFIEELIDLGGNHFRLLDTAGIRESNDIVEKEGILRAQQGMEESDLLLFVLDASRPLNVAEKLLLDKWTVTKDVIVVWNKIDLASKSYLSQLSYSCVVELSAKKGLNLEKLIAMIKERLHGHTPKEELLITKMRHKEALDKAIFAVKAALCGLEQKASAEFISIDIRAALNELGTIIGQNVGEEILSAIFAKFCIGK